MAIRWIEASMSNSKAQGTARVVLIVLANNADDQSGTCYPGIPYIAARSGVSERTVSRALQELEALGEVSIKRQHGMHGTSVYTLSPTLLQSDTTPPPPPSKPTICHPQTDNLSPKPSVEPSDTEISIDCPPIRQTRPTYPAEFEQFWLQYPKGHGNKIKAFQEWRKLPQIEREIANEQVNVWCRSQRWADGYIKLAELWLRDKYFLNDAPPPKKQLASVGRKMTAEELIGFQG